jgi:diadenosine tetraphosphatase ApaH/serine/threonine PP2A family protein phosphatase
VFAIISDIHGNLEALEAVLADIDRRGIKTIFCLGDVVGYGANPRECLDVVRDRVAACLCGNHDHAVFYEPSNFNIGAERACYWTRQAFEQETDKSVRGERWEYLGRLPVRYEYKGLLFVHGSPRRPVNEYLFPEDVYTNPQKILSNFDRLEDQQRACFVGHTHVPGVFLDDPYFDPPNELPESGIYEVTDDEKAIINVGSVGQPRDRDIRSCYVVLHEEGDAAPEALDEPSSAGLPKPEHDAERLRSIPSGNGDFRPLKVEFIRLSYDVEKAARKIYAIQELDDFLGNRLLDGR